jgi:hypothetical protein
LYAFLVSAPAPDGRAGTVRIIIGKEDTFYELAPIPEAAWCMAFTLTKEDRTTYAVNLGDPAKGMPPSCECLGYLRWGRCKHVSGLMALVNAGKL